MLAVPEVENKNDGKYFGAFFGFLGGLSYSVVCFLLEADVTCSIYLNTTLSF